MDNRIVEFELIQEAFRRLELEPFKEGDTVIFYGLDLSKQTSVSVLIENIRSGSTQSGVEVQVKLADKDMPEGFFYPWYDLWYFSPNPDTSFGMRQNLQEELGRI
jgi:hypothetical protein